MTGRRTGGVEVVDSISPPKRSSKTLKKGGYRAKQKGVPSQTLTLPGIRGRAFGKTNLLLPAGHNRRTLLLISALTPPQRVTRVSTSAQSILILGLRVASISRGRFRFGIASRLPGVGIVLRRTKRQFSFASSANSPRRRSLTALACQANQTRNSATFSSYRVWECTRPDPFQGTLTPHPVQTLHRTPRLWCGRG